MNSNILYKYFNQQASEEEIALVFEWIEENPEHKRKFIRLKAAYAMATSAEIDQIELDRRRSEIKLPKKSFKPWRYAAIVILMIAAGTFWYHSDRNEEIIQQPLVLEIHESQESIRIEELSLIKSKEGTPLAQFSENQLTYLAQSASSPITKQLLKVPYGKTLKVKLPDQTEVTLNAGSTLEFPSRFEGKTREVKLTGEAFFDVYKNKMQPFVVRSQNLHVEVLGTRFNIQAYPEDESIKTTLEEGSVKLFTTEAPDEHMLLSPGELATYSRKLQNLTKEQAHIAQQTAWVRGEMLLDNTPFSVILKKLERHFNVKATNHYAQLEKESFSGIVKLDLGIEEILQVLQLDTAFEYKLSNKHLILSQPKTNP
ncbi:FecR family protein [Leeuwenhoekiella nanhaiensis]|uniref:Anti-sigma factor n=1 Tax=Leeuwenhoekiella nanhaiensis TaxID=1655491 RepID=A0A2G1VS13_9FLAO|nr:FecR family protein [Leeuwenhoekiella nanhaiensis]PHQ29568.1 hypothetical protein CJ305_09640 [Leeuwenhoekiella nanhaiensis]